MKVSVIYWSGTGNTEKMAEYVAEGAKSGGADVALMTVSEADAGVLDSDVLLFGCPAMGAEELEETEFEPFFAAIEPGLKGRRIGLFGSYEWADGEWMRRWQERALNDGVVMIADGVIAYGAPDADAAAACRALGSAAARQI